MSTLNRTRPGENSRWADSEAFHIKPRLEDGVANWLGIEWQKIVLKKEGVEIEYDSDDENQVINNR